jgi:hypothetical protein
MQDCICHHHMQDSKRKYMTYQDPHTYTLIMHDSIHIVLIFSKMHVIKPLRTKAN